tara:strand:- start:498 stop:629 length:132 start_codon:yes stop_codon:yes gene_type:complete
VYLAIGIDFNSNWNLLAEFFVSERSHFLAAGKSPVTSQTEMKE